ncbi:MAG TPA: hypothetical protein VF017_09345 [Thermoanaerobaculia bacterium]|nr:hypothetical protein [Thermoanaerobaculia bacterium]
MIRTLATVTLVLAVALAAPGLLLAHDPAFTQSFDREHCSFTSVGSNPYFPLWPGHSLTLEGEEEDDEGALVELEVIIAVLSDTELVDGVLTRVLEERESEDGELVEVSRNFVAVCRETGDVWYFGEDVDDYEDGVIVGHGGAWRAGVDGALAGVIMPGSPMVGARYQQELAPGVAEDRGEVVGFEDEVTVPAGTFERVLNVLDTNALSPGSPGDVKLYAPGVGLIVDEVLELTEMTPPPCLPDDTTLCLNNGRFRVTAAWRDFQGGSGSGHAILPSADSGEFWFFNAGNTELVVKVLDGCGAPTNPAYWVFAAGLTNVEVVITVTDTEHDQTQTYTNASGQSFQPVLDTNAFATCP